MENIVPELTARGYHKAFVCSDPDLVKFGVTEKVTRPAGRRRHSPMRSTSDIKPNPTIENVQNGVAAFKACGADCIVAIGGGSSMDTAKAVGIIVNNPEFADVRSLEGVAPTKKPAVFTIAVPTTAGTAAEVTINYVITDVEKKRKFVCVDTHDIPEIAVVDPGHDGHHAQGPDGRHRHGRADPRHRGLYHQGRLGDDRHVPPEGHRDHRQISARRGGRRPPKAAKAWRWASTLPGMGFSNVGLGIVHTHGPCAGRGVRHAARRGQRHSAAHRHGVQRALHGRKVPRDRHVPWA